MINLKHYHDLDEIKHLIAECVWPDDERINRILNNYLNNDSWKLLGTRNNDELVGLIGIIYESNHEVELKHISIKPAYRCKGIGSAMINEFMETNKIVRMKAETDKDAVAFYKKIGFAIRSLGEKYPGVERFECIKSTLFKVTENGS